MPQRSLPVVRSSTRRRYRRIWVDGAVSSPAFPDRRSSGRCQRFRLYHRKAVLVTPPLLGEGVGAALRCFVREQQAVRHVLAAGCTQILLPQARRPAQGRENGPDQVVFGLALVGRTSEGEAIEDSPQRGSEGFERSVVERLPVGRLGNRVTQKIVGEEAALECGVEAHAPIIRESTRRFSVTP